MTLGHKTEYICLECMCIISAIQLESVSLRINSLLRPKNTHGSAAVWVQGTLWEPEIVTVGLFGNTSVIIMYS